MPRSPCIRIIVKINVGDTGAIAAAGFVGGGPSASALYYLRRMQTFEDKKRSTLDAMTYSASVGLTAHLDQVLFPTPGPLHPAQILSNLDQYTMYDPWLELHREGRTIIRLQINFLHNQSDPGAAGAARAPAESVSVLRRRHAAEPARSASGRRRCRPAPSWLEAQRLVAAKQWRNENSVQNLAQLTQVVEAYEKMNEEYGISDLRWVVHHVPEVTPELLSRLQGAGMRRGDGRVPLGDLERSEPGGRAARFARSSITASRPASTATACTSRR